MKNIEIKPIKVLISLEEYLKHYSIEEGDKINIDGADWIVHSVMPTFNVVIVTKDKEVQSVVITKSGRLNMYITAICVLKSSLSSIVGVEQLNLFKDE